MNARVQVVQPPYMVPKGSYLQSPRGLASYMHVPKKVIQFKGQKGHFTFPIATCRPMPTGVRLDPARLLIPSLWTDPFP